MHTYVHVYTMCLTMVPKIEEDFLLCAKVKYLPDVDSYPYKNTNVNI